ncbi:MAG TPA: class I SAM-dependent methyltransferase, partial [Polyangiaceae bacterium]
MIDATDFIPPATEIPECPVCGQSTQGIEVGTHGRFGMAVRNIACEVCALVYQSPRPTAPDMARYYAGTYRKHYGDVRYPLAGGGAAGPGEPGYEEGLLAWHTNQASNSVALAKTARGARVLEVGCRHGKTLTLMRDRFGIEPHGIEPGPAEAEQARVAGVDCRTGTIEEYSPGELRFDQIQLFHVLEHLHEPLSALVRMRDWLVPTGRLVIEVPNVYQPYGLLEENFFQNAHVTNFSAVTLPALLARAGFRVTSVFDRSALFVVAEPDGTSDVLPRPFSPEMLSAREH